MVLLHKQHIIRKKYDILLSKKFDRGNEYDSKNYRDK